MFTRCIFCHRPFAANEEVEYFPVARRIAYDPARGRLWAVCDACQRWTLAPFEDRWEALEELEKLTRDRGRLLSSTDNIALFRVGDVEIVRVGRAQLREEAWWRYGRELTQRRRQARIARLAEFGLYGAIGLATGGGFILWMRGDIINRLRRWNRFGTTAWRGVATCPRCGSTMTRFGFRDSRHLHIVPDHTTEDGVQLVLRCPRCGRTDDDGGYHLTGVTAEHTLRRVMAYHHFSGANEKSVRSATDLIEQVGSPRRLVTVAAEDHARIRELMRSRNGTQSIALEIALIDEAERHLLELELAALEERWREEEEIAAIVDRQLTWIPGKR
ncbi:MAG: hypothetical protein P8099_11270 [Gemmatimonadota bacterium]